MKFKCGSFAVVVSGALFLSGCVVPTISNTDFSESISLTGANVSSWSLANVDVEIPADMPVSEDPSVRTPPERFLVWYGDPPGDRKAQVAALMTDAVLAGAIDAMVGTRPVNVTVKIDEFHAMTPRARATNLQLGVHNITFDITVTDAATGQVLAAENGLNADLRAFSGAVAVEAEQRGQGQKIRIQTRVSQVVRTWLLG